MISSPNSGFVRYETAQVGWGADDGGVKLSQDSQVWRVAAGLQTVKIYLSTVHDWKVLLLGTRTSKLSSDQQPVRKRTHVQSYQ